MNVKNYILIEAEENALKELMGYFYAIHSREPQLMKGTYELIGNAIDKVKNLHSLATKMKAIDIDALYEEWRIKRGLAKTSLDFPEFFKENNYKIIKEVT